MTEEKPKIKLSELADIYDIEQDPKDSKNIPEKESKQEIDDKEWETTIKQGDDQLEDEMNEEW